MRTGRSTSGCARFAAYKTLGGSFTGNLAVDPTHLRDLKRASMAIPAAAQAELDAQTAKADATASAPATTPGAETDATPSEAARSSDASASDRSRRIRDAVEAALADILLLGTEEQVRLAAKAAMEMTEGRPIHTAQLVVSLRDFIRGVLDLDAVPQGLQIPGQGPARPAAAKGGGSKDAAREGGGARGDKAGGNGAAAGMVSSGGTGGIGAFGGASHHPEEDDPHHV